MLPTHDPTPTPRLTLSVLPGRLAVVRWPPGRPLPEPGGALFSVTHAVDELSVVCEEMCLEGHQELGDVAERGWVALRLHGPFPFTLTGILAAVLNPLRDAGVGIFALSTFDTDYVLVKEEALERATGALRNAGHVLR